MFGTIGNAPPPPPPSAPPPVQTVAPVWHPAPIVHVPVWKHLLHGFFTLAKVATVVGGLGLGAAIGLPIIIPAISNVINSIPVSNTTVVPADQGMVYMHWSVCGPGSPWLRGTNGAPPACNFIQGAARSYAYPIGPDNQQDRDICTQAVKQPNPINTSINSAGTAQWNGTEGAWCSTDPTNTVRPTGVAGTDWWDA